MTDHLARDRIGAVCAVLLAGVLTAIVAAGVGCLAGVAAWHLIVAVSVS